MRVLSALVLVSSMALSNCSKPNTSSEKNGVVNLDPAAISTVSTISPAPDTDPQDPNTEQQQLEKIRDELKSDLAERLNKVGLARAEIDLILKKMDEAFAQGFALTEDTKAVSSMIQRMASAAVRALGTLRTNSPGASLRLDAVVAMTSSFASYTARHAQSGEDLTQSLKAVTTVVSSSLAEAGIPPEQLNQTLAECGKALVVSVTASLDPQAANLQDIMSSAAAGFAEGSATSFAPEVVANAIGGLSRGIIEGALEANLSAAVIANVASATVGTITASLSEKGFDQEAISTQVLTGVVVAAKESSLAPSQLTAIIEQAATAAPSVILEDIVAAVDEQLSKDPDQDSEPEAGDYQLYFPDADLNYFTNKNTLTVEVTRRQIDGFAAPFAPQYGDASWVSETLPKPTTIRLEIVDKFTEIRWRLTPANEKIRLTEYTDYIFFSHWLNDFDDGTPSPEKDDKVDDQTKRARTAWAPRSRGMTMTDQTTSTSTSWDTSIYGKPWENFYTFQALLDGQDDTAFPWSPWSSIDSRLTIDLSKLKDGEYFLQFDLKVRSKHVSGHPAYPLTIDRKATPIAVISAGDDPETDGQFGVYEKDAHTSDRSHWGYQYWVGPIGTDCNKAPFRAYWFTEAIHIVSPENPPDIMDLSKDFSMKPRSNQYPITGSYRVCLKTVDRAGNVSKPFFIDAKSTMRRHFETFTTSDTPLIITEAPELPASISSDARAVQNDSGLFLVGVSADQTALEILLNDVIQTTIPFTHTITDQTEAVPLPIALQQVGKTTTGNLFAIVRNNTEPRSDWMLAYSDHTGSIWKSIPLPESDNTESAHAVGIGGKIYLVWNAVTEIFGEETPLQRTTFVKYSTLDISDTQSETPASWTDSENLNAFTEGDGIQSKIAVSETLVHILTTVQYHGGFYQFKARNAEGGWSAEETVGFLVKTNDGEIYPGDDFWIYGDSDWFVGQNYLYFSNQFEGVYLRKQTTTDQMTENYWEELSFSIPSSDSESTTDSDMMAENPDEPKSIDKPRGRFNPDILFSSGAYLYAAAVDGYDLSLNLYASSDQGVTWSKTTAVTGSGDSKVFFDTWNESNIAFVYKDARGTARFAASSDHASTWNTSSRGLSLTAYHFDDYSTQTDVLTHKGHVYRFTPEGIWRKPLYENDWSVTRETNYDLPDDLTWTADSEYLYVAGCNWFARSSDQGATWEAKTISDSLDQDSNENDEKGQDCLPRLSVDGNGNVLVAYLLGRPDIGWTLYRAVSEDYGEGFSVAAPLALGQRDNLMLQMDGTTSYLAWQSTVSSGDSNELTWNFSALAADATQEAEAIMLPGSYWSIKFVVNKNYLYAVANRNELILLDIENNTWVNDLPSFAEGTEVVAMSPDHASSTTLGSVGFLTRQAGSDSLYFQKFHDTQLSDPAEIDAVDFGSHGSLHLEGDTVHVMYKAFYRPGTNYMFSTNGGVSFTSTVP